MPSDSLSEDLMQAVEAALVITAGATYHHTVTAARINRRVEPFPRISTFPTLQIVRLSNAPIGEDFEDGENFYRAAVQFLIQGVVRDEDDPALAASRIEQDIITAIDAAKPLISAVTDTTWEGTAYHIPDMQDGVSAADVSFTSKFHVSRSDPSTGV